MERADMKARRRIGLLTPGWPGQNTPNGIATSVYSLANGLHQIGHTPVIFARNIDGPCSDDIPVVELPMLNWRLWDRLRYKFGDKRVLHQCFARAVGAAVQGAIETYGLDVLIVEETNGWPAWVQPFVPVPVIVTLHGPWALLKSFAPLEEAGADTRREAWEQQGFDVASGIIAPSQSVLAAVRNRTSQKDKPTCVLPNTLSAGALPSRSASTAPLDILFVGRFDFLKGADTVLEAFRLLVETHPQARMTFAGPDRGLRQTDGTLISINAALSALPDPVRGRITYKGAVDREQVGQLRREHAIALIASRYEVFGYTVLEAMAAGQAIVCTAVGGPADFLEHEDTALLVSSDSAPDMAAALGRLMDDKSLRENLGDAGYDKMSRDFNPKQVARDTVTFIDGIVTAQGDRKGRE